MIRLPRKGILLAAVALASCANPELEKRVADLEAQVKELKEKGAKGPAGAANSEEETAAQDLFRQANEAAEAGKYDEAKAKLAELETKYSATRAAKRAGRLKSELEIVGTEAGSLDVEKWYQGDVSFTEGKATLLVFWETWCPHCQREVPKIEETYNKYKGQGLNVVGLTKLTRNSTDEDVQKFIKEKGVSYPIAKEKEGAMSQKFAVQGIPAAAVVKDGKIVWRGHPARINDEMINGWLQG